MQGGTLQLLEPLALRRGAELLSCCFADEGTVLVGTRDRQLLRVDLGLDGPRKKREPAWSAAIVPQVPRFVGRGNVFGNGRQVFRQLENGEWEATEPATLEHARAFQSVALPAKVFLV